jgi:hypothetical protein
MSQKCQCKAAPRPQAVLCRSLLQLLLIAPDTRRHAALHAAQSMITQRIRRNICTHSANEGLSLHTSALLRNVGKECGTASAHNARTCSLSHTQRGGSRLRGDIHTSICWGRACCPCTIDHTDTHPHWRPAVARHSAAQGLNHQHLVQARPTGMTGHTPGKH